VREGLTCIDTIDTNAGSLLLHPQAVRVRALGLQMFYDSLRYATMRDELEFNFDRLHSA